MYDEKMEVELEDVKNNSFKYLDTNIQIISNKELLIRFHNKNAKAINECGQQRFLKYQHWHSNTSLTVKRALVVAMLHRIHRASSHPLLIIRPSLEFISEMILLQYPLQHLTKCIAFIERKLLHTARDNKHQTSLFLFLRACALAWNITRKCLRVALGV